MALAGPRLDRPSAIGDEGRPRTASLWIASLVVVGLVGVSGVLLEWPTLLPSLATFVGVTVAGVALLDRNQFGELVVGHTMLMTFGSPLALLVFVAPFVGWIGLALSGFIVALFGIAITWADVGDRDGLERTTRVSALSYVAMWGWLVVLAVFAAGLWLIWAALSALVAVSSPGAAIVGFLIVVGCSATAVRLSLRWLPIQQLAPRDQRSAVEDRLSAIRRATLATVIVSAGGLVIGVLLWGWFPQALQTPLLADAIVVLSSRWIVGPIVAVGTLSLLAGVLATALQRLARSTDVTSARRISIGLTPLLFVFIGLAVAISAPFIGLFVIVTILIGPLLLTIALAVSFTSVDFGVLPNRAGGPAIAASGLVLAAVGFIDGPPALVFACVAGAVLVWDVSSFGLGLTAELGHLPETRRLELFHGVIALGIAATATIIAVGLNLLRMSVFTGIDGTLALSVIVLGALILLIPLRG